MNMSLSAPTSDLYAQLFDRWPQAAEEPKSPAPMMTERHVQAMWLEQRYFKALTTRDGDLVTVIDPGIWNTEAGPDFRRAHIKIGDKEVIGDVELHLADDGWQQHGHHEDPRYDDVVLHVALWTSIKQRIISSSQGSGIPCTYLEPSLTIPLKRIVQLIDLDLYPYRKFVGSGHCAQALFRKMPKRDVEALLGSAAYWRLEQKASFLAAHIREEHLRIPAGVAMALGYRHNSDAFLRLFKWLAPQAEASFSELMASALGACGFFEENSHTRWTQSEEYRNLRSLWEERRSPSAPSIGIQLQQMRPLNHPVRRIAYLCMLLRDPHMATGYKKMLDLWERQWQQLRLHKDCVRLRDSLLELLPNYAHPFWSHHILFNSNRSEQPIALVGRELKLKVLVNTMIPLLYSSISGHGNEDELLAFDKLQHSLRAPSSGKQRYLTHRFFGDTPKGEVLKQSACEQGALQLHKDFCVHYEASCQGCPFVERVESTRMYCP